MRRAALLAPLALAACAVGPTLDQRLSTYLGRGEAALVAELGVPARVHEAEGRRFLLFESRRTVALPGPAPYGPPWGPWGPGWGYGPRWGWAAPPAYATVGCDVTFALRDGRVEGFSHRGGGC